MSRASVINFGFYMTTLQDMVAAARQGMVYAQNDLALKYLYGEGLPQDSTKALLWFRKAARQGDPIAQYNLGCMYSEGQGVERNITRALQWFTKAAEQGEHDAQNNLGVFYSRGIPDTDPPIAPNYELAIKWLTAAAEGGLPHAMYNLAYLYEHGKAGMNKADEALQWFKMAAQLGHPQAQARIESTNL